MINENFDKIDGKYVKNESNYYHYTNIENFHNLVNSFLKGEGFRGSDMPANLSHAYGGKKTDEFCMVRSDRAPDNRLNSKGDPTDLSNNSGDIRISFKEDKIQNKFGKPKPIQEYEIQDKVWFLNALEDMWKNCFITPPAAKNSYEYLKKNCIKISLEDGLKNINKLGLFCKKEAYIKEAISCFKTLKKKWQPTKLTDELIDKVWETTKNKNQETEKIYKELKLNFRKMDSKEFEEYLGKLDCDLRTSWEVKNAFNIRGENSEKMESRIKVPQGKFITLDMIKQILIPTYLNLPEYKKEKENVLQDIQKLKNKGFNNVSWYKCNYPQEGSEKERLRQLGVKEYGGGRIGIKEYNKLNEETNYFPY